MPPMAPDRPWLLPDWNRTMRIRASATSSWTTVITIKTAFITELPPKFQPSGGTFLIVRIILPQSRRDFKRKTAIFSVPLCTIPEKRLW